MAQEIPAMFVIERARDEGFFVRVGGFRGDSMDVVCAGPLAVCLEYIRSKLDAPPPANG